MIWKCRAFRFDLSQKGEILGILNVTPDSFSDGGLYQDTASAASHAGRMIAEGAAIIDIGGESTRPGALEIAEDEELRRVLPVVTELARRYPQACLSVDTSKAAVARAVLKAGASILNDVTGFRDPEMIAVAAEAGAGVICMHMRGTPANMQVNPVYEDPVGEVRRFFEERLEALTRGGIDPEAIAFDPGIGFGKTLAHNLELIRRIAELQVRDRPLLLGVSRKSFLAHLVGSPKLEDRSWGTIAITAAAAEAGVPLHRVHEVKPNWEALRMAEAISRA